MRLIRLAALCATATQAHAAWREVPLDPTTTRISYTVFALDLLPVTANFTRFHGTLSEDQANPATCRVQISIDVASLRMTDPDRQRQALAPDMLDAARYPTMRFAGICAPHALVGALTLHGTTRSLTLALQRNGPQATASGTLARRDYGILGMPNLVAAKVRLRLTVQLPN